MAPSKVSGEHVLKKVDSELPTDASDKTKVASQASEQVNAIGDIVLIVQGSVPRGQRPMAITEELFLDRKNNVRQVIVRSAKGRLRRDVGRTLCLLEGSLKNDSVNNTDDECKG